MEEIEKKCIGVVAAEVNNIEQREIMKGIIAKAQEVGRKTIVFSNLYNAYDFDESLALENYVYKLIRSPQLCGIILIAESFINETIRKIIHDLLEQRQDIPVVIIGIFVPSLAFPNVRFINASDFEDMCDITTHLIEAHDLREIDILTGMRNNEAAEQRVQGYRRALEQHGIPFDERRVHYGNFWFDSGEELAKQIISGEVPKPEAIVCSNDYMAYGLLDTFLRSGDIRVPDDLVVTGFEFIHERIFHAPLLSTYQRARAELGSEAVNIIDHVARNLEPPPFKPPKGKWIAGNSCRCQSDNETLYTELETLRTKQVYDKWNVLGTLEQQLTLSSNLDEFIDALAKHHYWVRWVQNMYLCLCENWYDTSNETPSRQLICRTIMPWNKHLPPVRFEETDFISCYRMLNSPETAVHYYLPLFFEKHYFGYFILEYHAPDTYDDIFRNWMKSISVALTFLCMKNDIRYLLQCQNLSEQQDMLTGLLNQHGFEKALTAHLKTAQNVTSAFIVKVNQNSVTNPEAQEVYTARIQKIADVLRTICPEQFIIARIDPQIFVCAGMPYESDARDDLMREKMIAVLLHQTDLLEAQAMETLLVSTAAIPAGITTEEAVGIIREAADDAEAVHQICRNHPHSETLFAVRNQLYDSLDLTADSVCRKYSFSSGYFRQIYKDCFGVSFHQDAINARISRAVSLLTTTVLSIASIAEQCRYEDYNYFLRQFQKVMGITPGQFRRDK